MLWFQGVVDIYLPIALLCVGDESVYTVRSENRCFSTGAYTYFAGGRAPNNVYAKYAYVQARKHSIFVLEHKHNSRSRQPPLKKSSAFFGTDLQCSDEFVVELVVVEQVVVGAAVSDAPVFQHNDLVGIKNGGKSVCDGDHGAG